MVKLVLSRKAPYFNLVDVELRRQADRLRRDNEELRGRLIASQDEKATALRQAEALRNEKERLRLKLASQKQDAEAQRKAHEALDAKIQALREENETLRREGSAKPQKPDPKSRGLRNPP